MIPMDYFVVERLGLDDVELMSYVDLVQMQD